MMLKRVVSTGGSPKQNPGFVSNETGVRDTELARARLFAELGVRTSRGGLGLDAFVSRIGGARVAAALAVAANRFADGGAGGTRLEFIRGVVAGNKQSLLRDITDVADEISQAEDPHAPLAGRVFQLFAERQNLLNRGDFVGVGGVGDLGDLADHHELGLLGDARLAV